jgi:rod shape-determining protein MreB
LSTLFNRPVVLLATPYRITEVEKLAVENAVFDAGAKAVAEVPAAMAAAAGAGLRISGSRGCMIVDMGGGTTEAAVISSGGMISARSLRVGGERLDMAIVNYLKNHCDLLVGDSTAEMLKLRLGTADPTMDRGRLTVYGRNVRTGLAATATVNSRQICEAITPSLDAVSRALLTVLEDVPPEIAGDIFAYGMMLCGGCALLPGLPEFLHSRTGLRVTVAKNPLDCVCLGLGRILEHPSMLGERPEYRMK